MSFAVHTRTEPGPTSRDATIYVLQHGTDGWAEVWPALGFNCIRWQLKRGDDPLDLLYDDPNLFGEGRPTRSGIPVLFPFPNRIRGGHFTWDGKEYQLPCTDSGGKNAIHGFACQRPWRIVAHGADDSQACVTGAFRGSVDAPDCAGLWPADYELRITYRLLPGRLRLEAEVANPDATRPLPFGLGFHPYFRLPFTTEGKSDDCRVSVAARSFWPLIDSLPTGERLPVDAKHDLNNPRRYGDLQLDDVLTDATGKTAADGLVECALIEGAADTTLRVRCSPAFRELVVYTPGHRQAFCVEPYTCVTDAVNLQARGVDAGWLVLPPGERWSGVVEMSL